MDNEIVRTTMISLTGIVTNFPAWRHNVTRIYALFILRDIPDNCPLTLESALKFLIQMVTHWKGLITAEASQVSVEYSPCIWGRLRMCVRMHVASSPGSLITYMYVHWESYTVMVLAIHDLHVHVLQPFVCMPSQG